jgi:hypothetical protein
MATTQRTRGHKTQPRETSNFAKYAMCGTRGDLTRVTHVANLGDRSVDYAPVCLRRRLLACRNWPAGCNGLPDTAIYEGNGVESQSTSV